MADLNAVVKLYNAFGGEIRITSASGDRIVNVIPGSVMWSPGRRVPFEFTDAGVIQTPLQGDEEAGEFGFDLRGGSYNAGTDPYELYQAIPSSATVTLVTFLIRVPDYPGAATGQVITLTGCWLAERISVQTAAGGEDKVSFKWKVKTIAILGATY